jgi:tetratricopeptide (TPR) repeat protein
VLTLLLAALATAGGFVFGLLRFGWGSGVLLALIAGIAALVLLMRSARKPIQAAMTEVEALLKAQRFEPAIERLGRMRRLGLWQPLLASQVDEQMGIIRYAALHDPDGALPFLQRARYKGVEGWAMLAATLYRRKRYDEMERVFQKATRRRSKEGLIWAAYAWCRLNRGKRAEALEVLARGRKKLPTDERLRRMELAVQNGKAPKMRVFGTEWYALELERVPTGPVAPGVDPRHPAFRRRGRG